AARRLLGLGKGRGVGQDIRALLPHLQVNEDELHAENSLPRRDVERGVDVEISAIRQSGAELAGQIVVLRDMSALRLSEQRFRAQYQSLPLPTYSWQKRGDAFVLVDHNAAAAAATRRVVDEMLGMRAEEVFGHRPEILADMEL